MVAFITILIIIYSFIKYWINKTDSINIKSNEKLPIPTITVEKYIPNNIKIKVCKVCFSFLNDNQQCCDFCGYVYKNVEYSEDTRKKYYYSPKNNYNTLLNKANILWKQTREEILRCRAIKKYYKDIGDDSLSNKIYDLLIKLNINTKTLIQKNIELDFLRFRIDCEIVCTKIDLKYISTKDFDDIIEFERKKFDKWYKEVNSVIEYFIIIDSMEYEKIINKMKTRMIKSILLTTSLIDNKNNYNIPKDFEISKIEDDIKLIRYEIDRINAEIEIN